MSTKFFMAFLASQETYTKRLIASVFLIADNALSKWAFVKIFKHFKIH